MNFRPTVWADEKLLFLTKKYILSQNSENFFINGQKLEFL